MLLVLRWGCFLRGFKVGFLGGLKVGAAAGSQYITVLHGELIVLFALGRCILSPFRVRFPIYLGLGVYGHGTCLHSLHEIEIY